MHRRSSILALLAAFTLLAIPCAAAMGTTEGEGPAPKDTAALYAALKPTLVYLEGEVRVDGVEADFGYEFKPGQTLTTGPRSSAHIAFGGANVIAVAPETSLRLDLGGTQRVLSVDRGAVSAVLKKLGKASGGSLELRTPAAVAGVRGTCLFVSAKADGSTYFCVCNGVIHLEDAAGSGVGEVAAAAHKAFVFEANPLGGFEVSSADLVDHDTQSVNRLASLLGVKVDWSAPERE